MPPSHSQAYRQGNVKPRHERFPAMRLGPGLPLLQGAEYRDGRMSWMLQAWLRRTMASGGGSSTTAAPDFQIRGRTRYRRAFDPAIPYRPRHRGAALFRRARKA
jgi:hypothetical protein